MDFAGFLLLLLLSVVKTQEVTTPSTLLRPRNFNHHPYDIDRALKDLKIPEQSPTKQGPVLFPNDGPPPSPTPLIVTSRPLSESIARSELNSNNTVAAQSQVNGAFVPAFLGRVKTYRPFGRTLSYEAPTTPFRINYDYEAGSDLPPIYKTISDRAPQNVQKVQQSQTIPKQYDYQVNNPIVPQQYNGGHNDDSSSDYNHGEDYAFSYTVKDRERGDDFSHSQKSSGSATNGEYRVRLPDGRMQIVSYTADENGYKADVRYDDEEKPVNDIDQYKSTYQNDYNNNNQNVYKPKHNNIKINSNNNENYNDYNIKASPAYVDTNKLNNDYNINDLNDNFYNNNAKEKQFKVNDKDYSDVSKEYYNDDYSSEYNVKYEPHSSKFNNYLPKSSTVKPSYEDLKNLFTKDVFNTQQNYDNVDSNIRYTTQNPLESRNIADNSYLSTYNPEGYQAKSVTPIYVTNFNQPISYSTRSPLDFTTERTVLIGGKRPVLFTDIKSSLPSLTGSFVSTTPASYLVSTVSSLKNNFNPPVLSKNFYDKIQKYLSFK